MRVGILTSSRADFGIYYPLIKQMWDDSFFSVEIIAFGTHLKPEYGYTVNEIEQLGFSVPHKIKTDTQNDTPADIARSIGTTVGQFADFWNTHHFDLVFALGDRYEMFAAVSAASPFNIAIAHIHGGETTLGAIDNAYRHSISLMSKYIFVTTEEYKKRAQQITDYPENVFNVGALSIDNLQNQDFFSLDEFRDRFDIDLSLPTILSTFHPETVSLDKNKEYISELLASFKQLQNKYQIVITMPNADTLGTMIRKEIEKFGGGNPKVKLVESFGMKGYLTCMKYCKMMIGNTSSGFVEAAFFPTWVINLGNRQKGRIMTDNIITIPVKKEAILKGVKQVESMPLPQKTNIYGNGKAALRIVEKLKQLVKIY